MFFSQPGVSPQHLPQLGVGVLETEVITLVGVFTFVDHHDSSGDWTQKLVLDRVFSAIQYFPRVVVMIADGCRELAFDCICKFVVLLSGTGSKPGEMRGEEVFELHFKH